MEISAFYNCVVKGDVKAAGKALSDCPWLIDVRNPQEDAWDEGWPLHCAAKHGHLSIVRLLVERGAEVYSNPMASYPPVMVAAWNKRQAVVDFFLNEIPDKAAGTNGLGVTVNLAARQGWIDIVRKHVAADPLSVHQRGWIGDTPLHWPAHNNFVEIVGVLLDAGAEIEADEINCYGGKPLHWASEHAPGAVRLLLERGANVNARNLKAGSEFFGMTPLIMNATQKGTAVKSRNSSSAPELTWKPKMPQAGPRFRMHWSMA
jgi:ankyrin repeat protein